MSDPVYTHVLVKLEPEKLEDGDVTAEQAARYIAQMVDGVEHATPARVTTFGKVVIAPNRRSFA